MPTVASYCTVFLKPEMLHIYRQVTGLQRYDTFVVTKERMHKETFDFDDVMLLDPPRNNFLKRFIRKYLQNKEPLIYRGEFDRLMKVIGHRKPDLMHIYFGHTGVHLLPFIRESRLPCVVSFHGADVMPRKDRPGYEATLRKLLHVIPLALARSESLSERLRLYGCPPEKIRINRTGIPLEHFTIVDRSANREGGLRIVQACRLIEKKGLQTSLRAFAEVVREFHHAHFDIAGEGPLRETLESLAAQLGIAEKVRFLGFLDQEQLRQLYADGDVFLHPSEITAGSDQEGVPNSMLEAMATGLPVVATLHGGIPEAVRSGVDGLLVPERNVPALAAALTEMLQSTERRLAMGKSAAEAVRSKFDQATQIARLEECYDEVLAMSR